MNDIRAGEHQFKGYVEQCIVPHLHSFSRLKRGVRISTKEEDTKLSYDMTVGLYVPVSVRLRENQYLRYHDFTIRSRAKNGGKTEVNKLMEGLGLAYFYAWLTPGKNDIEEYIIVDIDRFRGELGNPDRADVPNGDGTKFNAYSIDRLRSAGALVESGPMAF